MNWDAIGAIGQAVSAFALIFVIVQVRHAQAEMRRSITRSRVDALRSTAMIAMDPRVLGAELKASAALGGDVGEFNRQLMNQAGLTAEEAQLLFLQWAVMWQAIEQGVQTASEVGAGERYQLDMSLRFFYGTQSVSRLWYQTAKPTLNSESVRYIDNVLAQPG